MEYRTLGGTGLHVSTHCLGTMMFGAWGNGDVDDCVRIIHTALDAGINFVDTADVYANGESEEIVGKALKGRRDEVILATKVHGGMGPGPNDQGLSRYHIMRACDESLRRLGTDVIDLYQVHSFDPRVPIDETLGALDDLVHAGKVRYIGCSNYPAWRLGQALAASARMNVARYDSLQPRYNVLFREIETELLPLCRAEGLGVIVYNPLAGGFLSGKYRKGDDPQEGTRFMLGTAARRYQQRYWDDAQFDAVDMLRSVADGHGVSLGALAIAWVMAQPGITSAIVGASSADQLDAAFEAAKLEWNADLQKACDAAWYTLPRRPVIEGYR
jgi:aryl-alcohol dehydrogenase-like predicted oxidoreductase